MTGLADVFPKARRRALVRLYPGIELPTDCDVVSAGHDYKCGLVEVCLSGPWLPKCDEGAKPRAFWSMEELLSEAVHRATINLTCGAFKL